MTGPGTPQGSAVGPHHDKLLDATLHIYPYQAITEDVTGRLFSNLVIQVNWVPYFSYVQAHLLSRVDIVSQ